MQPLIREPGHLGMVSASLPLEIPVIPGMIPLSRKGYKNPDQEESSCLPSSHPGTADDHLGVRSAGCGNSQFLFVCLSSRPSSGWPL